MKPRILNRDYLDWVNLLMGILNMILGLNLIFSPFPYRLIALFCLFVSGLGFGSFIMAGIINTSADVRLKQRKEIHDLKKIILDEYYKHKHDILYETYEMKNPPKKETRGRPKGSKNKKRRITWK